MSEVIPTVTIVEKDFSAPAKITGRTGGLWFLPEGNWDGLLDNVGTAIVVGDVAIDEDTGKAAVYGQDGKWQRLKDAQLHAIYNAQHKVRVKRLVDDSDTEEVDPKAIAEACFEANDQEPDGSVQVLDGMDAGKVHLEHFSGSSPENIKNLIHFIKANDLQQVRPWCVVWNLYLAVGAAAD